MTTLWNGQPSGPPGEPVTIQASKKPAPKLTPEQHGSPGEKFAGTDREPLQREKEPLSAEARRELREQDNALKAMTGPTPPSTGVKFVMVEAAFVKLICAGHEPEIVTESERSTLRQLQGDYSRLEKELMRHVGSSASVAFQEQQALIAAAAKAGEEAPAGAWDLEDFRADHWQRRKALASEMRAVAASAIPIAAAVAERIASLAGKLAATVEEQERKHFERFGMPVEYTLIAKKLRSLEVHWRQLVPSSGGTPPSKILLFSGLAV